MSIRISRPLLDRLLSEVQESPDHEICGLLLGTDGRIGAAIAARNISSSPNNSFEIDPQTLFDVIRLERSGVHTLMGHYHSHPNGLAEPSPRDAESAKGDGGRLWLIMADDQATLWRFTADPSFHNGFEHVPLTID